MPAAIPIAAAVVGGLIANKGSKDASKAAAEQNDKQIAANAADPRISGMLFGDGTQTMKPGVAANWQTSQDPYGQDIRTLMNPQSDYTTNNGLLGQYQDLINKPQSQAMQDYGNAAGQYLQNAKGDLDYIRGGAYQQMQGQAAPQMQAAQMGAAPQMQAPLISGVPQMQAAQFNGPGAIKDGAFMSSPTKAEGVGVGGPAQNNMDLTKPFDSMINGAPGANPYLTGAIQKGINQSTTAFQNQQADSTRNLMEQIMPGIRGGAIASGQYGSSRQGIAEGRAIGDYGREQQRALSQFGQNNTDAAVSAQAGAYDSDSNRALSAMQGLSGQQNSAAIASANNQQAANLANLQAQMTTSQTNAQLQQQRDLQQQNNGMTAATTQGGWQQQANAANQGAILGVGANNQNAQMGTNNANLSAQMGTNTNNMNSMNSAGANNLQAQMGTNALNSQNYQQGMAGLGGLLGNAYANAGAQDQYGMNQAIQGNSLLAPYLSKTGTPTQLQPVYNNSGSAALGGALAGAQIGQGLMGMFNSNQNTQPGAQNVVPRTY